MANNIQAQNEPQVENQVSGFETFVKKYEKIILWAIIAILVIVFGSLAYQKWVATPAREEARSQMFVAEQQYRNGDYEKALKGDGNNLGFEQVIEQYGSKAGESAYLYAGICDFALGNYEEAVTYLKKYDGKDFLLKGKALCCIGDSYVNLGDNAKALEYFKKAAAVDDNSFRAAYLFKAGLVCEELGKEAEALEFYQEIKTKYPQSVEGYDIDKYISRIQNK